MHPVEEAAAMCRLSRALMYQKIASGEIASIKIGNARRIPHSALLEFIDRMMVEQLGEGQPYPVTAQRRGSEVSKRQTIERQAAEQPGTVPAGAGTCNGSA
jgi:excisionase family DNA binding protein